MKRQFPLSPLIPSILVVGVMTIASLIITIAFSFLTSGEYGGVIYKATFDNYIKFVYDFNLTGQRTIDFSYFVIFGRSILLALYTSVLCIIIGFPVAYFISLQKPFYKIVLVTLLTIPFWSNILIRNFSLIAMIRDAGLLNLALLYLGIIKTPISILYTQKAVLIGMVYSYIPFFILPVYASLENLPKDVLKASSDLYASKLQTLRYVVLPLNLRAIISGALLVFIPAVGAFLTPDVLGGGKTLMLGNLIQMQFSTARNWTFGAALSVVLLVIILVLLIIFNLIFKKTKQADEYDK